MEPQICGLGTEILSRGSHLDFGISSQRAQRRRLRSAGLLVLSCKIRGCLRTRHFGAGFSLAVWNSGLGNCASCCPAAVVDDARTLRSTSAHLGRPMRGMWIRLARSFRPMSGMRTGKQFRFGMILGRCGDFCYDAFFISSGFGSSTRSGGRTPGPLPLIPKSASISATSFSICLITSGCCAATSFVSPISVSRL